MFSTTTFDLFATIYIYGSITSLLFLLIAHLYCSLLVLIDESKAPSDNDFYSQVKDLLALPPATVPAFQTMTMKELRSYIRDNDLNQQVKEYLSKPVYNARKNELVAALR